jgi:hypothetical protein
LVAALGSPPSFAWRTRSRRPNLRSEFSASLVQVDVVVTNSNGNHIRDLEAADFQIYEDG